MPGPGSETETESIPADGAPSGPDFTRRVVTRRGEVLEFATPEAAAEALARVDARGEPLFTPDTPDLREQRRIRREYGDRPIAAGGAAAASEATIGLSDQAGAALGYGEDLRNLRESNPEASTVGSVVGAVAPIVAFGPLGAAGEAAEGVGLLGRAARAVTAPGRLVAGGAEAAGGLVRGALTGPSLLRRAAGTIGGLATEGAIEGAAGELGRMVSENALEDTDFTAEAVLSRLGSGTLLGAATGGILGGGGSLLREIGGGTAAAIRGTSDILRRAWSERVGTELLPDVADAVAFTSGRRADDLRAIFDLGPNGRRIRQLVDEGDAVFDRGTLRIRDSLNELERARLHASDFWRRGLKREQMDRLVDTSRVGDQMATARATLDEVRNFSRRVVENRADYRAGSGAFARRLGEVADAAEARIASGNSADIFSELDTLKRELGEVQRRLGGANGQRGGLEVDEVRRLYNGIRENLEATDLWGEAAEVQRRVNAAYTLDMETRNAFARRFLSGDTARDDVDAFRAIAQGDTAQVDAFLRRAGTAANDSAEQTYRQGLQRTSDLLRSMRDDLDLPPDVLADITAGLRAAERAGSEFDEALADATRLNQWRAASGPGAGFERTIAAGSLGLLAGGPLGAALANLATNPAIAARALGMLERLTQGTAEGITDSVRGFLRAGTRTARTAGRRLRAAGVSGTEAYRRRTAQLDADQRDPRAAAERMARRLEGLEEAPRVRSAVAAGAARGNAYLTQHRPNARVMAGQLVPDTGRLPSPAEVSAWLRRARVVDDPMAALEDLRSGTITPEAVDALRQVYPRLYRQIQETVMRELAQTEEPPGYYQRLALGRLLGIPTDPSLTPTHMAVTQSLYMAEAAAQPTTDAATPEVAGMALSPTERLERRSVVAA